MNAKSLLAAGLLMATSSVWAQDVNVNCAEGANWQKEKSSSVFLGYGSAGLLNGGNGKVYLWTARHCLENESVGTVFSIPLRFNYENTSCFGSTMSPYDTTINVTLKMLAKSPGSNLDYAFAEVITDLSKVKNLYLAGWNANDVAPSSGTFIGYPNLLTKKIGTFNAPPVVFSTNDLNMHILFNGTANGYQGVTTGVSGSPVFDQNHRVVGTAVSGYTDTYTPIPGRAPVAVVSKFASAWYTNFGAGNIKGILDTLNNSGKYMNGIEYSELQRLTKGAKYIVSKHSNNNIRSSGALSDVIQGVGTDPGTQFYCGSCYPEPETHVRASSRWYLMVDEYGYYKIHSQVQDVNMDFESNQAGTSLSTKFIKEYPNDFSQRFRLIPTGDGDNSYFVQNVNSGLFLDIEFGSLSTNSKIIQWAFNGQINQKWYFKDDVTNQAISKNIMGTHDEEATRDVKIFPTVTSTTVTISSPAADLVQSGQISDGAGKVMATFGTTGLNRVIDVSGFASGIYFVKVKLADLSTKQFKFIVK